MLKKKAGVKKSRVKSKLVKKAASKPKHPKVSGKKATAAKAAVAPPVITHEMIVARAHAIWLRKNLVAQSNNSVQNWREAEAELREAVYRPACKPFLRPFGAKRQ